ncbi:MAG: homoserine dehydrogenase [Denitrovibrio sp.]|nr:MAG: homoserine dehydrogenase [Denitrovibrio sp.]
MAEKINVGLIGYGTVGKGTAEVLINNKDIIFENTGINVCLKTVADLAIDTTNPDELLAQCEVITNNADDIINDPDIHIVVELIGGYTQAKDFIIKALNAKKHVVSANKALFAMQGTDIYQAAEMNGVTVCFEGAVAGGIPIVRVLKEDLAGNNIKEIFGIINGTANYILTNMEKEGKEFDEVLKVAQEKGYAEADPTFDIEGMDTAHKIAILASIGFNTLIPFEKIYVEGITSIKRMDIEFANKLDCKIKLLAIAKKHEDDIEVRVHPTMVPREELMAQVDGVFNAVEVIGDMVDKTMHYGRGAGGKPTGSAVVGDIIGLARDIVSGATQRTPVLGFKKDYTYYYPIKDIKDIKSAFYLRFSVVDEPGTLAIIATILAKYGISISEAIQPDERAPGESVNMVFMTHKTVGRKLSDALDEIDKSDVVRDKTVAIRVKELI